MFYHSVTKFLTRNDKLFTQTSGKRAAIVYKIGNNAHAQSVICSLAMFLTNAHAQSVICTQLFASNVNKTTCISLAHPYIDFVSFVINRTSHELPN